MSILHVQSVLQTNNRKQIGKISFVLARLAASLSLTLNFYGRKEKNPTTTWQAARNVPLYFDHKHLEDFCKVSCHLSYPGC